jgi:hypothetical protein
MKERTNEWISKETISNETTITITIVQLILTSWVVTIELKNLHWGCDMLHLTWHYNLKLHKISNTSTSGKVVAGQLRYTKVCVACSRSQNGNISTKKVPFLSSLKVVLLSAGNKSVICCTYCSVSVVVRVRMPPGLRVALHLSPWSQSDPSATSLVIIYLTSVISVTYQLLRWWSFT